MSNKKIPLFATAGAIGTGLRLYNNWKIARADVDYVGAMMASTVGISKDGKFTGFAPLIKTVGPIAIGTGMSMAASKLKLNKYLSSVPFIKW